MDNKPGLIRLEPQGSSGIELVNMELKAGGF
jgi:hypothetical protein